MALPFNLQAKRQNTARKGTVQTFKVICKDPKMISVRWTYLQEEKENYK
jgi:hypothetical protein